MAIEGFEKLAAAMTDATEGVDDSKERLNQCGKAYVRTALAYPGHFAVIFQNDLIDPDNEQCVRSSLDAYTQLQTTLQMVRDQLNPDLDVDMASSLCWASMQGLVVLSAKFADVADQANTATQPIDETIEGFTEMMIEGFRAR